MDDRRREAIIDLVTTESARALTLADRIESRVRLDPMSDKELLRIYEELLKLRTQIDEVWKTI